MGNLESARIMPPKASKYLIELYAGPGAGKSTLAADLFAHLKKKGLEVELVREYVKDWVWENRTILPGDQAYICAKQCRKERILLGKADIIITDAPTGLAELYEEIHEPEPYIVPAMVQKHRELVEERGYRYRQIFVRRGSEYNPTGRWHTEKQAHELDERILRWLDRGFRNIYMFDQGVDPLTKIEDLLNLP